MAAVFAAMALLAALALPAPASAAWQSLTVTKTGSGKGAVRCEVSGSGTVGICAGTYPEGTELILYAEPAAGSEFVEWSGDCAGFVEEVCELWMEEPRTVTAEFGSIPEYALTVQQAGAGQGTVECEVSGSGVAGPCAAQYPKGTELILYAEAALGSEFVEWSGDCVGVFCELWMEEAHAVTATFALEPPPLVSLAINEAGSGTGTVECKVEGGPAEACAAEYPEGAHVALVAKPAAGSEFAGWSEDCAGESCELWMNGSYSVTATFDLEPSTPPPSEPPPSTPPSTSPPPSIPPPPSPGQAVVAGGVLKVKGGMARVKLACTGAGPCEGALRLLAKLRAGKGKAAVIGRASFSLSTDASETLKVRLSRPADLLLKRRKPLKAAVAGSGLIPRAVKLD